VLHLGRRSQCTLLAVPKFYEGCPFWKTGRKRDAAIAISIACCLLIPLSRRRPWLSTTYNMRVCPCCTCVVIANLQIWWSSAAGRPGRRGLERRLGPILDKHTPQCVHCHPAGHSGLSQTKRLNSQGRLEIACTSISFRG
jgi:hypothetical protein